MIKNFLEEALKGDVCKLIESHGNYFDPRVLNIDCQMVMNGILKRGYIISVQKLLSIFTSLENMFSNDFNEWMGIIGYLRKQ